MTPSAFRDRVGTVPGRRVIRRLSKSRASHHEVSRMMCLSCWEDQTVCSAGQARFSNRYTPQSCMLHALRRPVLALLPRTRPVPATFLLARAAMSSDTKSRQPPWYKPQVAVEEPVLKVYNSLTRSKDVFVPINGKRIDWYNCGPTVYDAAHMGHARNYLTQDLIRRILRDYFGYEVNFVMNVTDIDDKVRAKR